MGKNVKQICRIGAVYLGTVLGAGFASGQELTLFFTDFSRRGLLGAMLAGCLFCFFGNLILSRAAELPEKTFRCYLESLFPKKFARFLEGVTELFLWISFCIMLSGTGAYINRAFSLKPIWGILLTDLLCLLVFLKDVKGLSLLNMILCPFLLVGILVVSLYGMSFHASPVFSPQINDQGRFLAYAFFYVGYNMLTATAVLVPTAAMAPDKKTAGRGGLLGGGVIFLLAFISCLALYLVGTESGVMPMLSLAEKGGRLLEWGYGLVLYMAMLTTAVSAGFSAMKSLTERKIGDRKAAVLVCLFGLPLSLVEFSVLVKNCYVFFGILGLFLLWGIFWEWYKRK